MSTKTACIFNVKPTMQPRCSFMPNFLGSGVADFFFFFFEEDTSGIFFEKWVNTTDSETTAK